MLAWEALSIDLLTQPVWGRALDETAWVHSTLFFLIRISAFVLRMRLLSEAGKLFLRWVSWFQQTGIVQEK